MILSLGILFDPIKIPKKCIVEIETTETNTLFLSDSPSILQIQLNSSLAPSTFKRKIKFPYPEYITITSKLPISTKPTNDNK